MLGEFQCKCCSAVMIDPKMLHYLQCTRDILKCPIVVTSGYRCLKHNTDVHGHNESGHMAGRCADIMCPHVTRNTLVNAITSIGWPHVKEYTTVPNFFHLGV
jgi:uncharacterized protein YcbK (DUF882 family)